MTDTGKTLTIERVICKKAKENKPFISEVIYVFYIDGTLTTAVTMENPKSYLDYVGLEQCFKPFIWLHDVLEEIYTTNHITKIDFKQKVMMDDWSLGD